MDMRRQLEQMDNRLLYLNLAITQGGLLLIGSILYALFMRKNFALSTLFHVQQLFFSILIGVAFAAIVLIVDLILMKCLPKGYFDDGGINERLFRDPNLFQIMLIALAVAVVEEWLFRGVLQNLIGLFWTSLIFALIHYRYLRRFFYALLIIALSFSFGLLYEWTGSLWSVISAHFLIDFCLGVLIRYRLVDFK